VQEPVEGAEVEWVFEGVVSAVGDEFDAARWAIA